jgi:hypothetical protein
MSRPDFQAQDEDHNTMAHPIPKQALDDRLAFVGTAGSGKTYNAGSCVERLLSAKARVVVIDPLGVWWGLRLKADGLTESPFNIPIFGGNHGDLALTEHAGALIGETVAGMEESCILDLSQIGTKAGERRFMLAFLTALYRGVNGSPVHLVIDEADMWAPQRLLDKEGEAAKLLGMMETIVRRGRVKGFIPWLITQRPAVLSKDVLSQADGMIAFKLTASQDRDAIGAWIEGQADKQEGKNILAALPSLERGRGVVWIPTRGILETASFPLKVTFDSSRTPKRGEKKNDAVLRPLDLGKLKDRLSKVDAETKANDPKALKAEIAVLRRDLATKSVAGIPTADPQAIESAYQSGIAEGLARGENRAKKALAAVESRLKDALAVAGTSIESLDSPVPAPLPRRQVVASPATNGHARPLTTPATSPADGLTAPQRRVMTSLAFWKSIGHETPTREQVAAIAGYRPGSGNFNNLIGGLSTMGQTTIPAPGRLSLNVEFEPLSSGEARDQLWSVFENPQRKLVEAAKGVDADLSRDELATNAGYAPGSGNFNNIAGKLSSMDVLRRTGTGRVALSDWAREVLQ